MGFINWMESFFDGSRSSVTMNDEQQRFHDFCVAYDQQHHPHCEVNPATGLTMVDHGSIDVGGNPYGVDLHSMSMHDDWLTSNMFNHDNFGFTHHDSGGFTHDHDWAHNTHHGFNDDFNSGGF